MGRDCGARVGGSGRHIGQLVLKEVGSLGFRVVGEKFATNPLPGPLASSGQAQDKLHEAAT
jgi:hypothetical protein